MKTKISIVMVLLMGLSLAACGAMQSANMAEKKGHASLTEQQKLISCADCHREATPKIYQQWYASTHGIGNVKCYQCHNSYEDLAVSPDIKQSCNSCHADKVEDKDHTQGVATCWECHQVHGFAAE